MRLAACLLLCFALVPAAQAAITLPVPWQQGMQLRYRSTSDTEKVRGKLHTRVQVQDITELRIVEANEQGFVQAWHSRKPEVATTGDGGQVMAERRMVQAMLKRFENLPLEAKLDAEGNYTGLRNWEALGAAMREVMLPLMVAGAVDRKDLKGVDAATLRARLEPVLAKMTTQAALDTALGRQAQLYNFFVAPSLKLGEIRRYEEDMASPWSPDPIPSKGSFELVAADERAVTIRWRQDIDPTRGLQSVWKMVETLTGVKPGELDMKKMPEGLELNDEATVVLARASGIPQRIEHRRRIALGGSSTDQRWTLELLPDAAR